MAASQRFGSCPGASCAAIICAETIDAYRTAGLPCLFLQVRVPFYDDTITRVKADALLYDEDSFSWSAAFFQQRSGVEQDRSVCAHASEEREAQSGARLGVA